MLAAGVSVAVQVMPLNEERPLSEALGAPRSAMVKPETASVKVKVTVAVSPIVSAVSLIVMLLAKAGRCVSTA